MEGNEEEECEGNFPSHAGFGPFHNDDAMEELKERRPMRIPQTILGRHYVMHGKILKVKRKDEILADV
jgi:hypothetical protein